MRAKRRDRQTSSAHTSQFSTCRELVEVGGKIIFCFSLAAITSSVGKAFGGLISKLHPSGAAVAEETR